VARQCFRSWILSRGIGKVKSPKAKLVGLASVYIDDMIVFSSTLEDHIVQLGHVFERLLMCGLKRSVLLHRPLWDTWGMWFHCLTSRESPCCCESQFNTCTKHVRRFLGMSSYYHNEFPILLKLQPHYMQSPFPPRVSLRF